MKKKAVAAQSTIEIVVLVILVATAVLFMNRYVRRSVMGMLKQNTDKLGKQFAIGGVNKYEYIQNSYSETNVEEKGDGSLTTDIVKQWQNVTEIRNYDELSKEETLL